MCAMPRKSEALHELNGTKPHDRTVDVSHVPAGKPKFPKDLDKSLRPVFKRLCKLLQERRVLTAGDADLLRLYCFAYERHERNVQLLREEGEVVTVTWLDKNGVERSSVKANPRLKVVENAEKQMAAILGQLGLTQLTKDRAKRTREDVGPRIVPGSIAHLYPELLEGKSSPSLEFKPPQPISANEMETLSLDNGNIPQE